LAQVVLKEITDRPIRDRKSSRERNINS